MWSPLDFKIKWTSCKRRRHQSAGSAVPQTGHLLNSPCHCLLVATPSPSPVRSWEVKEACPALVGNRALRRMSSVIFANFFENGNGLLTVDIERDKPNKDNHMKIKLFRLLLMESGHYLLPTGEASRTKMPEGTKQEVTAFLNKVATQATRLWKDVYPKMKHCFMASSSERTDRRRPG